MIVIDCSILIAATMKDEHSHAAEAIFQLLQSGEHQGAVPSLFFLEVSNVLVNNYRRNRLVQKEVRAYAEAIRLLPLERDDNTDMAECINLAIQYDLSAYDAAYLELAKRKRYSLATLDKKLGNAAMQAGVLCQPSLL